MALSEIENKFIRMIHDLKLRELRNIDNIKVKTKKSKPTNNVGINNQLISWYWNVGFNMIQYNPDTNCISIYVTRPNKFIGNHNFLKDVESEAKTKLGVNIKLVKSYNKVMYDAFFGTIKSKSGLMKALIT